MRNRRKTLLRDHLVLEVTLKACPKHYSVSAIPETLTIRGPKRPPINGGESGHRPRQPLKLITRIAPDLDTGICHALEHNKILIFSLQETPTQLPARKIKSMLNKEPLYSSTSTEVDTPHGTQGTCV